MKHLMPSVAKPKIKFEFDAIGTHWVIECAAPAETAVKLSGIITNRISQFDTDYSRFRPDSWVTYVGSHVGAHKTPADFAPLFLFYKQMYKLTDGLVTPLIGDALERAGYDARYRLLPQSLQSIPEFMNTLQLKGNTLHVKYNCVIDFGAAGKGYLVDLIATLLEKQGITDFLIDAGGDILVHSPTPHRIGLEDPDDPTKVMSSVSLLNQSICASATNRRNWGPYHHIINPKTLRSVDTVKAVWVIANSTMLADGLATCLFFVTPEKLSKNFDFKHVIIHSSGIVQSSMIPSQTR